MPRARTYKVNPDVFRWARERLNIGPNEAAGLLGIRVELLRAIESGDEDPRVSLLETAATRYGLSLITLLAPTLPRTARRPDDFRTIGGSAPRLSAETLGLIEQVQAYREDVQEFIKDLEDGGNWQSPTLPQVSLSDDPTALAVQERDRLGISIEAQLGFRDAREAFAVWRWKVEDLGIFVFLGRMPRRDCRGFSLWDENRPPTIVINSRETDHAKQFTLFHEYAHLLRRASGICRERENVDQHAEERFANQFAANLLMPLALIQAGARQVAREALLSHDWDSTDIESLARRLRLSRPSVAIRLEELGLAPEGRATAEVGFARAADSELDDDLDTWRPDNNEDDGTQAQRSVPIPVPIRRLSVLGSSYPELVFTALDVGAVDDREAALLLNTGIRHFGEMRGLLQTRRRANG